MKVLLDVSTLIALIWPSHVHHHQATAWSQGKTMAVCPITQLGFLRVSSGALNTPMPAVLAALESFMKDSEVEFIPCDLSALKGLAAPDSARTTDWYLANLAHKHGMKWATLDQKATHPAAEVIR